MRGSVHKGGGGGSVGRHYRSVKADCGADEAVIIIFYLSEDTSSCQFVLYLRRGQLRVTLSRMQKRIVTAYSASAYLSRAHLSRAHPAKKETIVAALVVSSITES